MPRVLRSRGVVLAVLAAFVLAQPAAWCSALCLLERHHGVVHATPSTDRSDGALRAGECHTASSGAVERAPLQALSPMTPAVVQLLGVPPARWVAPTRSLETAPHDRPATAEPPPPRLV